MMRRLLFVAASNGTVGKRVFRVLRMDDNGHTFEVRRLDSQLEAQNLIEKLVGDHPHKQTYWIESEPQAQKEDGNSKRS